MRNLRFWSALVYAVSGALGQKEGHVQRLHPSEVMMFAGEFHHHDALKAEIQRTLSAEQAYAKRLKITTADARARGCRRVLVQASDSIQGHMKATIARAAEASCAGFVAMLALPDDGATGIREALLLKQVFNWAYYADGIAKLDFDGTAFAPTVFFARSPEQRDLCLRLGASLSSLSLFCATSGKGVKSSVYVQMAVHELGIPVLVTPPNVLFLRSPSLRLVHDGCSVQFPQIARATDSLIFFPGKHVGGGFFSSSHTPAADAAKAWASDRSTFFHSFSATKDTVFRSDVLERQRLKTPWTIRRPGVHASLLLPEYEYRDSSHAMRYESNGDEYDERGQIRAYRERFIHKIEQMVQAVAYVFQPPLQSVEYAVEAMKKAGMWQAEKLLATAGIDAKALEADPKRASLVETERRELMGLLAKLHAARARSVDLRVSGRAAVAAAAAAAAGTGAATVTPGVGGASGSTPADCRRVQARDQPPDAPAGSGGIGGRSVRKRLSAAEERVRAAFVAAAKSSCHGFIQFVIASKPSICYLDNYLYFANGLASMATSTSVQFGGYPPLVVVVGDKATMQACTKLRQHYSALQLSCVKHILYTDAFVPVEYGSPSYKRLVWTKPGLMKIAVDAGIPVLMTDIDIVQYKSAFHFLAHDGRTVQTYNEEEGLIKPNTGFVFLPGEHIGGGRWSTTAPMRAFAADWNKTMDAVWKDEFFEEWLGKGFGNPQNEQLGLYRMHFREVTVERPDLRPKSWGPMSKADPEHKQPKVFKKYDLAHPWAHHTMPGWAKGKSVEWRALPPYFAFSTSKLPPEELVATHFISVGSKIKAMQKAGVWQAQLFGDPKRWCSYDTG
eukprot:g1567.t1